MPLYSIKMRASKGDLHVSGAERIIPHADIGSAVSALTERALHHGLGRADFINVKMEEVAPEKLEYLDALPVSKRPADTVEETYKIMKEMLCELGLEAKADALIDLLRHNHPMRGAVLYDVATNSRLEPDHERGIRVTYMDAEGAASNCSSKNHFREAIVLATKVVNAPGIIAELCLSDDPDYLVGYLASLKHGYVRLMPMKEMGNSHGGRVFIFDSSKAKAEDAINYLEKQRVLVRGLPVEKPANPNPEQIFADELKQLKEQNLYRSLRTMDSEQSKYVEMHGRKVLMLASNSYLDLAADARVKQAAAEAALQWGAGSGGSRLTTGNTALHEALESKLAHFKGTEAALVFNTGYMANVGIISALCNSESVIFSDEYNHASIIDGARLSKARIVVYKHNDMQDLEAKILATPCSKGLIVSDAVFSMDGDIVDLPALVALGKKYHLLTMIDEAHATGVIGKTGFRQHRPDILMGTLSKALGAEGGYACASKVIIEYLKNKARSFIFATSQTPATLAAALRAIEVLEEEPQRAQKLQHNVEFFLKALHAEGVDAYSPTAIIPVIIGDEATALQVADELLANGVLAPAIRYPTVAKGTARLRVALMATHTEAELSQTAKLIGAAIRKYKK
jgi:8-amino-7-oxononanoate synthase